MEVETSLNALMCALSRAYSADSCLSTSYGASSSLRKAARDATLLLFDTNIAGLGDVLKQVNSSITTLAISIRRARNSLCDINRLPVEIFHAIFRFVSEPSQEPFAEHPVEFSSAAHLHPLRLSQVCAHWRVIALEQRTLWSRLDITTMSKGCLELFQKRAGDCLLTVSCPVWYKTRWPEFWSESSAKQRMKTMELALPPPGAHNNASIIFDSSSAPFLENLYLSNFGACVPLPHVFPGGTPRLQQLHVKGFNIEWRSGLYKNLTTLCLHDTRLAYMLPIGHLDDLLQMINDSPNLEQFEYSLVVHGRQPGTRPFENNLEFPEGFPPVLATASRILLGHLRKVRLVMPSSKSAAYILNRISFPTTVYGFDLNIWGPCDLEDLLHPDIIPPCLLQSMSEAIFDCTARSFESYSLTSYFAALERAECGAVRSGFLVCWSSDRPFYEGICEVARLLARDYPELPIRTQTINLGRVMPWAIADQLDDLTSPLAHNLLLRSAPLRTLRLTVDESIYLEELFDTIIEELDDTPACSHIAATFARWHGLTALEILDSPVITIREMDAATSLAQALNSSGRLESLAIMGCTIVADQDDTGNPGEQLDRIIKRQSGLTQLNILYDDVTADSMRKLWDSKRG